MGICWTSKEERYEALRGVARNALEMLKVEPGKPIGNEDAVEPDWTDPTVVPLEFRYQVWLNIRTLASFALDSDSESLESLSKLVRGLVPKKQMLDELRTSLAFVQMVLAGAYTDDVRARFRAKTWTQTYEELEKALKMAEESGIGVSHPFVEARLKVAEEAFTWFPSGDGLESAVAAVARNGTKLQRVSVREMEYAIRRAREALASEGSAAGVIWAEGRL